jgi:putative RNA 2'-phosphotransferase
LGRKQNQRNVEDFTRLLDYVLGRRPDEFGLIPDKDGFVPVKELLQAIHEEAAWRHIRRSHVNEALMGAGRDLFQLEGRRIRAVKRLWRMEEKAAASSVPKLLFTPVRRRAHAVALEKGLRSPKDRYLPLSLHREMAHRIGQRRDPDPVLIEVMAFAALTEGVPILSLGDLFLSSHVPARFLSGPAVPKELLEKPHRKKPVLDGAAEKPLDRTPGSFPLDLARDTHPRRLVKGRKPKGWKEDARKTRRRS